mmetsp:Transcript_66372/g.213905  ORF Transcript_66372/g.213905 Transcript_66372/m.213905 type:complete len:334 (+) Transcript_66372:60-1061(+)
MSSSLDCEAPEAPEGKKARTSGPSYSSAEMLSAEQQLLFNALNAALGSKIDGVSGQVSTVSAQAQGLQETVMRHDTELQALRIRLDCLEKGGSHYIGSAGSGASAVSTAVPSPTRPAGDAKPADFTPKNKRQVIVFGGWPSDTEREIIVPCLKDFIKADEAIGWLGDDNAECYPPGPFGILGKVKFSSCSAMWSFVKTHQGVQRQWQGKRIWHSIDQYQFEREIGTRTSRAVSVVKEALMAKKLLPSEATKEQVKRMVPTDWDMGIVRVRVNGVITRIFETSRSAGLFTVSESAGNADLGVRLAERLRHEHSPRAVRSTLDVRLRWQPPCPAN